MDDAMRGPAKRRGAPIDPPNRFDRLRRVPDDEHADAPPDEALRIVPTETYVDDSRSIVAENDSPDVGFRYSVNPYRGCEHGCAYCFARPTHETLGFNAGLDFETKIAVKPEAPRLLREFLSRPGWKGEPIVFSGVTDCYQPLERKWKLTRQCLEVALEYRQPIGIVTKGDVIVRDLDLLGPMGQSGLAQVLVSLPTLDESLSRELEPRAPSPTARLRAIEALSSAGVPVAAMLAPVIPSLTDSEIPTILASAAAAGARAALYAWLRLPGAVGPIFLEWLERRSPAFRKRVESAVREMREGKLNHRDFGMRMRGKGERANRVGQIFHVFSRRHGIDVPLPGLDSTQFRAPGRVQWTQGELF